MDINVDNYYNKPTFLLNTTNNSNAIVAFTENSSLNLKLINNVSDNIQTSKNEISFKSESNKLSILNNNVVALEHQHDTLTTQKIHVNTISNNDTINFMATEHVFHTPVRFNNYIHLDSDNYGFLPKKIPLLDDNMKIPLELLPQNSDGTKMVFSKGTNMGIGTNQPISRLHVFNGHTVFEQSFVGINSVNDHRLPECPIHIRSPLPRIGHPVMKLTDTHDSDTVIFCSENPFIGVGTSNRINDTSIQLYVDSNIQCKEILCDSIHVNHDIHIDGISFQHLNSNLINLNNNSSNFINKLDKLYIDDDNLYINSNIRFITENEFNNYNPFSDGTWNRDNIKISHITCVNMNTYYIINNNLYDIDNNLIDTDVLSMKSERDELIYKKINSIHVLGKHEFKNSDDVSYDGIYFYILKDGSLYRQHPLETDSRKINISLNGSIKNLSENYVLTNSGNCFNINNPNTIIESNIVMFKKSYDNVIFQRNDGTIYGPSINYPPQIYIKDTIYWDISKNNLLIITHNGEAYLNHKKINISSFITDKNIKFYIGSCSNRHIGLYNNDMIWLKSFDDNFNGLGRNRNTIYGDYNSSIIIPVSIINDRKSIHLNSGCVIGKNGNYINNSDDSILLTESVGIKCKPDNKYALKILGDINIEGGKIYIDGNDVGTSQTINNNNTNNINLENYPTKSEMIEQIDSIDTYTTNDVDIMMSNVNDELNKLNYLVENIDLNIELKTPWQEYSNVVYIENRSIGINTSNIDTEMLGTNKTPALYVGNNGNVRGILCEDDIAVFSDRRLKEDIEVIKNPLDKVDQLYGVYFKRIDNNTNKRYMGLIAQDIENVVPEVVSEINHYKTVSYQNLVALLIEAIKELKQKIV